MTPSLLEPPLLVRLKRHPRILIAGAGGGFDVYAGLPVYVALRGAGHEVFLANLTFTSLGETDCRYLAPHLAIATPETKGGDRYFPERRLAEWLHEAGCPPAVYAFEKVGVRPLRHAYAHLVRALGVGAVVLVDGRLPAARRGQAAEARFHRHPPGHTRDHEDELSQTL
jgi:hypothetical protein